MQNDEGALFLNEAKELEKGYDWVGAAASYEKAANLALKKEDLFGTAGIYERIGYCFYRAALQAETKKQFESRMKLSAEAYGRLVKHLQRFNGEGKEEKLDHAKGLYAFAKSWIAPDFFKMADLLEEWWKLENKVLAVYEEKGDLLAIGKTCNNLIAYSQGRRIFFSAPEYFERRQELINIGEKAIAVLSKLDDAYELAQAYCSTGFYYGLTGTPVTHDKWRLYSEKAVALSKTSGDQWLIGWAHNAAWIGSGYYDTEFASWLDHAKNIVEAGKVSKDNHLMAVGSWATSLTSAHSMQFEEDPDKQRQTLKKASEWAQQALIHSQLINWPIGILLSQNTYSENLVLSASMETSRKEKRSLLEKAVEVGRKSVQYAEGQPWVHVNVAVDALSKSLFCLAMTETSVKEKTRLLKEALAYRENYASEITTGKKLLISTHAAQALYNLALIQSELARIEAPQEKQIQLFDRAVSFLEKCTEIAEKFAEELPNAITSRYMGFYYYAFGGVLSQVYKLTKKKSKLADALEVYKKAAEHFDKAVLTIHVAECHWQLALLHNLLGEHLEGSQSYALAAKAYKATAEKTPQLKSFCEDYSTYMLAWSEVEKAMHHDSKEEYEESGKCFERAANLFEASRQWSYMAPNYSAWALMENAETESRKENPQSAAEAFGQAFEKFKNAEDTIKRRIAETESPDEKATISRLIKTANLRSSYCQARINIEEAKVHDQKGEYTLSSKSYGLAAETLNRLVGEEVPEQPQQELRLLLKLCRAWAKMEFAEEKASPAIYLEASQLFEEAKEQSLTKKSSLLALGNSSFCKGLAAGTQFQTTLEPAQHSIAKRHMETAATFYLQAGFPSASEYAKATLRLFDAYVFMNKAETEIDPTRRAQNYSMAEKLLQISAGSFLKANQPEKVVQVQKMMERAKEEKNLAISLGELLHAPVIASSTTTFTTLTPVGEEAVGLERFEHADVQANLISDVQKVKVGENLNLVIEFVNTGKEQALLTRVEKIFPAGFAVVEKPEIYRIENDYLNLKGKSLAPLKTVEVKLVLQPLMKGEYLLKPKILYYDEMGDSKSRMLEPLAIKVEEVILPDRISTGTKELDTLLLGGIPQAYAVVLTGPPVDERERIIKGYLETGVKESQATFFIAEEEIDSETLVKNLQSNFYLFLTNAKADSRNQTSYPNLHKVHGSNLTNLGIALVKAYRSLNPSLKGPRRICIEIVSNVLLREEAVATTKWLSELISDLKSKNFTILAVMNPLMHPSDQFNAVLNLFDGEISLYETEGLLGCKKYLRVKKLRNQDYIKNPICLAKHAT